MEVLTGYERCNIKISDPSQRGIGQILGLVIDGSGLTQIKRGLFDFWVKLPQEFQVEIRVKPNRYPILRDHRHRRYILNLSGSFLQTQSLDKTTRYKGTNANDTPNMSTLTPNKPIKKR